MFKKMLTTRSICVAALIAALYAALTMALAPLSFAAIQCRVSEALTILPVLLPQAIPGLTVGCLLANLLGLSGGLTTVWDVVFGTLATLLAALGTWAFRRRTVKILGLEIPLLSALCPVLSNAVIVGLVLSLSYGLPLFLTMLEVGVGELIAVCIGLVLLPFLKRIKLPEL